MRLTGDARDALWGAVLRSDFGAYRAALAPLRLAPAVRPGGGPFVPVRCWVRRGPAGAGLLGLWEACDAVSRPIPAARPGGGGRTTLGDCLFALAPDACVAVTAGEALEGDAGAGASVSGRPDGADGDGVDSPGAAAAMAPGQEPWGSASQMRASSCLSDPLGALSLLEPPSIATTAAAAEAGASGAGAGREGAAGGGGGAAGGASPGGGWELRGACWVAGTRPPLGTHLEWLHANLHAPDGFLYVVVHVSSEPGAVRPFE